MSAAPPEAPSPVEAVEAERDALIARIVRGEDPAGSVQRFIRLRERRDELLRQAAERQRQQEEARKAAEQAAIDAEKRARAEQERQEALAAEAKRRREAEKRAYLDSLDHHAGRYCYLSVDPRQRHFKGGVSADWGRVARKVELRIPGKRPLDDETVLFLYEIDGVANRHVMRSDHGPHLQLDVGDLVFLCGGPANHDRHLPPPWNEERLTSPGYSGRLAEPPRIAKKGRWEPIHITNNDLWHAIKDQVWRFPEDRYYLANVHIGALRPDGRYEIPADDAEVTFLLEVPKGLPRRELFVPGEWRWVIMGSPRFDRPLKSLVLVAADIEARYIVEKVAGAVSPPKAARDLPAAR